MAIRLKFADSSYKRTANALLYTGPCGITGVKINTDGNNNAVLTIYDNTSASGDIVEEFTIPAANMYGGRNWVTPVKCENGIYAVISGTNAAYFIEYLSEQKLVESKYY